MENIEVAIGKLEATDILLKEASVLEVFGRGGDWHTLFYATIAKNLDVWEVDSKYLSDLRTNLPDANVKICDSFEEIKVTARKYDIVVIDNPQSMYGNGRYCEHFEMFPHVYRVMTDRSAIIMNVNLRPYDLKNGSEWWRKRSEFYNTDAPQALDDKIVENKYKVMAQDCGFITRATFFVRRNEYISYYVTSLLRR